MPNLGIRSNSSPSRRLNPAMQMTSGLDEAMSRITAGSFTSVTSRNGIPSFRQIERIDSNRLEARSSAPERRLLARVLSRERTSRLPRGESEYAPTTSNSAAMALNGLREYAEFSPRNTTRSEERASETLKGIR